MSRNAKESLSVVPKTAQRLVRSLELSSCQRV